MKKIFLIIFLFCSLRSTSQTFFGVGSTPADNGANTTDPTVITEPGSMVAGDLCVIYGSKRNATGAIAMSATGGQTWTAIGVHNSSTATLSSNAFYCTFNGTWSASPSVSFSATTNNIAVMLVFRPSSGSNTWGLQTIDAFSSFASTSSWTFTTASFTPANNNNVTVLFGATDDDNQHSGFNTSGFSNTGLSSQYRNTSGSDASEAFGYKLQTTAASITTPSISMTIGPDPGIKSIFNFYEIVPAAPHSRRITIIQ